MVAAAGTVTLGHEAEVTYQRWQSKSGALVSDDHGAGTQPSMLFSVCLTEREIYLLKPLAWGLSVTCRSL